MVQQFWSTAPYPALRDPILPGTPKAGSDRLAAQVFEHLCCLSSVFAVTIEDQVARCSVFRESLSNLLRNPRARGMFGDIEMKDLPAAVADHEEAVKHAERDGRDRKEIHGSNRVSMVLQKNQ